MQHWQWSDVDRPLSRGRLFTRSAEFLTTAFLIFFAAIFLLDRATISRLAAFTWAFQLTGDDEFPWAVASFILAIVGPLAVLFDDGRLRLISLLGQGTFFLFLGCSALLNARDGVLWGLFLICGCWLLWRFLELAWPRLVCALRHALQLWLRDERRG